MSALAPAQPRPAPRARRTTTTALLIAAGILLLALGLRLALLIRSGWLLEGDDSLSTLMALGILQGDHPIMLKNQTYAGAWEPYLMALSFSLFGVSRAAAKLPELLTSLAAVGATGLLGHAAGGRRAGWLAALLMAAAPIYDLVMGLKPWAPYTEVILFGSLSLWCALRLSFRAEPRSTARWAAACGLAGGFAFWMHPIAAFYLLPAAVVVALRLRGARLARAAAVGIGGFLVGALPVWIYNLQTGGATLRFVLTGSEGQTASHRAVLGAWWQSDLPRAAGLWSPWGSIPRPLAATCALVLAAGVVLAALRRPRLRPKPSDGILLLLLSIPFVFVMSGFGGPALNPYGFDATGRYAPPVWSGLAVTTAMLVSWLWQQWRPAAAVALALVLGTSVVGYVRADPVAAFQSPYWPHLPVNDGPLLATLRADGVTGVIVNHWAGFPLMFDARAAGQQLVAYDWYDPQAGGIDRFPENLPRVLAAPRMAYVLVTIEADPALAQQLRSLGVRYQLQRVPPYEVIVPLSRRVEPWEVTTSLDYRY